MCALLSAIFRPTDALHVVLVQRLENKRESAKRASSVGIMTALQSRLHSIVQEAHLPANVFNEDGTTDPFKGMQVCRELLKRMDQQGWCRSYHQRLFHGTGHSRKIDLFYCIALWHFCA